MSTQPLRKSEKNQEVINEAIAQLQQGRSNAHGSFSLAESAAVETTVVALTCSENSHVNITPTNGNAGNIVRTSDVSVTAGVKQFVVSHGANSVTCTFTYSLNG